MEGPSTPQTADYAGSTAGWKDNCRDPVVFPIRPVCISESGAAGRLRSLHQFMDQAPHSYASHNYGDMLRIDHVKNIKGKPFYLLNLPYYLAGQIHQYADWFIEEIKHLKQKNNLNKISPYSLQYGDYQASPRGGARSVPVFGEIFQISFYVQSSIINKCLNYYIQLYIIIYQVIGTEFHT